MTEGIHVWTATVLGIVQGLTEFLPVSSSGHVALSALLFGEQQLPLTMVVTLHFGTLLATVALFRRDIIQLTQSTLQGLKAPRAFYASPEGQTVCGIVLASIPTAVIGLSLEGPVETLTRRPAILGVCFLVSALAVLLTRRGKGEQETLKVGPAILVGIAQGIAVLPGVSRSATTIACAMLLGLNAPAAFRFSFLLSLPAILGASLLELRHFETLRALGWSAFAGGCSAFLIGYLCLLWLRGLVTQGRFWLFCLYLIPLGVGLISLGALGLV